MPETMTPRERMLAAINHQPVDRVPTDIWATPEIWAKLRARYGTEEQIFDALHIDLIARMGVPYAGPALPAVPEGESVDFWGARTRRTVHDTGAYQEQYHYPLAAARTIDDLEQFSWPDLDWFDYPILRTYATNKRGRHLVMAGAMCPFTVHNALRGLEQSLLDPLDDPAFTHHLLDRIGRFLLDQHRRMFEAAGDLIDATQVTDDLGTQTGPMISLGIFREFYKPWMQRCCALAHEFGLQVFHHDDGAIRPFLPDLIEIGVDILNPIQWRCPGMDAAALQHDFGGRLVFHGAIDNQQTLPHGTPDDVRAEVRQMIDVLGAAGTGYILAPCHSLQPVTPLENIEAMYDEARRYGKY
ncbi:uroporphyrinogen-III decarboxylase-like protein [bacterium]|nr:uroporphyrinogen-III decarboxylase-like protein [bacterium]